MHYPGMQQGMTPPPPQYWQQMQHMQIAQQQIAQQQGYNPYNLWMGVGWGGGGVGGKAEGGGGGAGAQGQQAQAQSQAQAAAAAAAMYGGYPYGYMPMAPGGYGQQLPPSNATSATTSARTARATAKMTQGATALVTTAVPGMSTKEVPRPLNQAAGEGVGKMDQPNHLYANTLNKLAYLTEKTEMHYIGLQQQLLQQPSSGMPRSVQLEQQEQAMLQHHQNEMVYLDTKQTLEASILMGALKKKGNGGGGEEKR
ncbi:hypothetical protein TrLO_g162 [Triparma laevis f. longispina]|uniref:Uncharacterized protein n=2 Tax=Triparma laevis f. longispina TaxID=1714387 RepID=A0A9W6ZP23_9STRA|nr:hypothetical protein TrLO_g162 [Triparma laevis f. longispina]